MSQTCIILGAGHSGVQAAASLREKGFEGRIQLLNDEADLPYHKPPLSKGFLKQETKEPLPLRAEKFFTDNDIEWCPSIKVIKIDVTDKHVLTETGAKLSYDKLILATGARSRRLSAKGAELAGIVTLRDLADARQLDAKLGTPKNVVICGGGFIGVELAHTLKLLGSQVTLLEAGPQLLGRAVAPEISERILHEIQEAGVGVRTQSVVIEFAGTQGVVDTVKLQDGTSLPTDLVVLSIGAVPNTELAGAAGLDVANGILVNAQLQTSNEDIYAIGDCVSFEHWQTQAAQRLESVQNAVDHGRHVAAAILDGSSEFKAVPWFWSDQGELKLQIAGLAIKATDKHVVERPEKNGLSVYHFEDDKLIAVETINGPAEHMMARKLLETGLTPTKAQIDEGVPVLKQFLKSPTA